MKKTRSMRRMRNMLVAIAALTLVLGVAIGGTIAYLVASAGAVTNTFTVGQIGITLKEHNLNTDGSLGTEWVDTNTYHIVPGDVLKKDPTVTVTAGSEACYVFVCVENQLVINNATVATPAINTGWTKVAENGTKTVYKYDSIVANSASATQLTPVFSEVTISSAITETELPLLNENSKTNKIIINAFAHQSDNATPEVAQNAALTHFGFVVNN